MSDPIEPEAADQTKVPRMVAMGMLPVAPIAAMLVGGPLLAALVASTIFAALGQNALEGLTLPGVVRYQNLRRGGKKVVALVVRIAPPRQQLVAQAILHGQRHLDPAGTGADAVDRGRPG